MIWNKCSSMETGYLWDPDSVIRKLKHKSLVILLRTMTLVFKHHSVMGYDLGH